MEKGGHGTPPANKSTFLYFSAEKSLMSLFIIFQFGRFKRRVSHAIASISTKARCSKPACSNPTACPPAPAHIIFLLKYIPFFVFAHKRSIFNGLSGF